MCAVQIFRQRRWTESFHVYLSSVRDSWWWYAEIIRALEILNRTGSLSDLRFKIYFSSARSAEAPAIFDVMKNLDVHPSLYMHSAGYPPSEPTRTPTNPLAQPCNLLQRVSGLMFLQITSMDQDFALMDLELDLKFSLVRITISQWLCFFFV